MWLVTMTLTPISNPALAKRFDLGLVLLMLRLTHMKLKWTPKIRTECKHNM